MKRVMILMGAALLALAACDEKKPETKPEDPSVKAAETVAEAGAAPAEPAAVAIADDDLSTPADFEETAEKGITKANYKAELASLETDIAKE